MKRNITRPGILLLSLALVVGAAQAAPKGKDGDCTFLDVIADEVRSCSEGPAELSWKYLEEDKYGELRIAEDYAEKFADYTTFPTEEIEDGGDPAYDESASSGSSSLEKLRDFLVFLVRLAIAAGEHWENYVEDVGLSGHYDGRIANRGSSTNAFLDLSHSGSQVGGQLIVLDSTLELDGGICGTLEVPVGVLNVTATSSGPFDATGYTQRPVRIGPFSVTVDVSFDLSLEQVDYEGLDARLGIDVPFPCSDQELTGYFSRRNVDIF